MNNPYRWLLTQAKPVKPFFILTITLSIASAACMIIQLYTLSVILDRVFLHQATRDDISIFLWIFLLAVCLRTLFIYYHEMSANHTAQLVKNNVRQEWLARCLKTPEPGSNSGELTTTLIDHIEALHGFFSDYLPQLTIVFAVPLCILGIVFSQNWVVGTLLLCTAPLIPIFMILVGSKTAALQKKHAQLLSRMNAYFLDRLQGLATLIFFHRQYDEEKNIRTIADSYRVSTLSILRIAFLSTATLELFATIAIAMIAVYLGLGLLGLIQVGFSESQITLQKALFILFLAPEFFASLRQLGTYYHARNEAIGAAAEII